MRLDQPQYQPFEINCAVNNEGSKILVENFNMSKVFELASREDDLELIDEGWYTLFIAEDKLQECPKVKATIGNKEITCVLDTGCELWLMSQGLCNKLHNSGMRNLEQTVQSMKLVNAFDNRVRKVKTQAMLTLKFGEVWVDQIFLIAP